MWSGRQTRGRPLFSGRRFSLAYAQRERERERERERICAQTLIETHTRPKATGGNTHALVHIPHAHL